MRIPLSWLGEIVELPEDVDAESVHASLVSVGLEEEDVHRFDVSGPVVVGRVLSFEEEPQKNGKTIRWCQVRVAPEGASAADGGDDVRGIVCGAGNFLEGDLVVVTLPGAVLPGPFPIAARKTYGHVSDGMIASASELGLGLESDGILRLVELGVDAAPGTDAIALLGLDDVAVEVNVTPDRGYAFSIRGIAREYAHATGVAFADPATLVPADTATGFSVAVDDAAPLGGRPAADVFVTRVVEGIDATAPTPPALVSRLALAGIRSISLPVDVTNAVMLELGQPIHGYDLDRVRGGLTVRRAAPGERLVTLDGVDRELHPEDIVIADESGAIGLAGVMGGQSTEIGPGTTRVLVEAARFDPVSIARTARRHRLPSEASKRFERGVDPAVAPRAANRVARLLAELAGGSVADLGSALDASPAPAAIRLPASLPADVVGVDYEAAEIARALVDVGCALEPAESGWLVTPPTWRPDLVATEDLVEEVARVLGYDRIPAVLPVAPPGAGLTRPQRLRRLAADALAAGGAVEVLAYPFLTEEENAAFAPEAAQAAARVVNALDATRAQLRVSLLPGLVQTAKRNLERGQTDQLLFEVGTVFRPDGRADAAVPSPGAGALPSSDELAALRGSVPGQPRLVSVLSIGRAAPHPVGGDAPATGVADMIDQALRLGRALGVRIDVANAGAPGFHPGRTARLSVAGEVVGIAGELHPELAEAAHLPRVVGAAEIDLDALIRLAVEVPAATPLSTYPAATQDLSLVVPVGVPAGDVLAAVVAGAGDLLEDARLVDDYRGAGLEDGEKSLTFALRFRAADRTLTQAEATEARDAGVAAAAERVGATLRA